MDVRIRIRTSVVKEKAFFVILTKKAKLPGGRGAGAASSLACLYHHGNPWIIKSGVNHVSSASPHLHFLV